MFDVGFQYSESKYVDLKMVVGSRQISEKVNAIRMSCRFSPERGPTCPPTCWLPIGPYRSLVNR